MLSARSRAGEQIDPDAPRCSSTGSHSPVETESFNRRQAQLRSTRLQPAMIEAVAPRAYTVLSFHSTAVDHEYATRPQSAGVDLFKWRQTLVILQAYRVCVTVFMFVRCEGERHQQAWPSRVYVDVSIGSSVLPALGAGGRWAHSIPGCQSPSPIDARDAATLGCQGHVCYLCTRESSDDR